jgi:hypothetical protein
MGSMSAARIRAAAQARQGFTRSGARRETYA